MRHARDICARSDVPAVVGEGGNSRGAAGDVGPRDSTRTVRVAGADLLPARERVVLVVPDRQIRRRHVARDRKLHPV